MRGYLGLGSNVGDRRANLKAAVDELRARGITVRAESSMYETAPQGEILDQPDFLNAAVALGRDQNRPRHSPRPIDVDLLLLDDIEYHSQRLTLPHAEVTSRRFVLEPLLDLDPELALPDGTRLADVLPRLMDQRVERR